MGFATQVNIVSFDPRMEPASRISPPRSIRRWFGPGALVTVVVFVLGRLAMEPLRSAPHFDDRGMEAYGTTEAYLLRKDPAPVKVAFFGSSQSVWAIMAGEIAVDIGEDPAGVRNLAVEGGTPFDMWNLLRRNEEKLQSLRVAVVEVNPFVFKQGLDSDVRVSLDIAQHGTLAERLMLARRTDRLQQLAEWVLPLQSVRRSLQSAFLNVADPDPGFPPYPCPEQRTHPAVGWKVDGKRHTKKERQTTSAETAAKRMVGYWKLSKLQDHAMRESLAWFARHHVRVIFHELPVHPEVIEVIRQNPVYEKGHQGFLAYVDSLRPVPFARSITPDPADCGITANEMADRTHLNQFGAAIYSSHLAAKLRSFLAQSP
jgi:hypothetical protein